MIQLIISIFNNSHKAIIFYFVSISDYDCQFLFLQFSIILYFCMKRRGVLSGIKKSTNVPTIKSTRSPTLFDHTSKIEQKLTKLKQQIEEKKKNNVSKTKINIQKPVIIDQQLTEFLSTINMTEYLKLLCDNGIDSLEVMREIKQKQLEQIGISKGHSLKIMVSMKKMFETREKNMRKQLSSAETAQNTQKLKSKAQRIQQNIDRQSKNKNKSNQQVFITKQPKNQPLQIVIQTQSMGIGNQPLPKRKYFCLYCYQVAMDQFCGADCQQMYNKMFEKYEKNLAQVHQLYGGKVQRISQIQQTNQQQQDQLVDDLNFLDLFQYGENELNLQAYQEALQLIKITNSESKQEEIEKALQEKQGFQQQKLYQ